MAVPDEVFDPERWGKLPAPVAVPAPAAPDARAESRAAAVKLADAVYAEMRKGNG